MISQKLFTWKIFKTPITWDQLLQCSQDPVQHVPHLYRHKLKQFMYDYSIWKHKRLLNIQNLLINKTSILLPNNYPYYVEHDIARHLLCHSQNALFSFLGFSHLSVWQLWRSQYLLNL